MLRMENLHFENMFATENVENCTGCYISLPSHEETPVWNSRIIFGVFYDWVAKKGTTAVKVAVISMQETSQGSVEPVKEHCWQIWYSIFWQIRPSCSVRNTLCLVHWGGKPYKSDRCGHNSEWKKILTSSPGTLAYGVIDLGVFLPLVIHLPSEKSILPKFSSLRGVAILGWESLSQARSASPRGFGKRPDFVRFFLLFGTLP